MKSMHRLLSALLACIMLMSVLGITAFAEMPEKLFEFDLSKFEKSTTEGSSGAVNIGTSKTAEITAYSTSGATGVTVDLGYSAGVDGEDYPYLRATHVNYNWQKCGTRLYVEDLAWEAEETTFSYWIDLGTENENAGFPARAVTDYCVIYDDNGTETKKSASIYQIDYEVDTKNYRWNFPGYNMSALIDLNNSREWNHVVLTNPRPNKDGNKIMDLYINGVYVQSASISVPKGTVASATMYFGRANDMTYCATDTKVGNFEVYKGILSEEQVMNLYAETRGNYGFEAPNTIVETTEEVKADTEAIEVSMMNDINKEELGTVTLKRKSDGTEVAAEIKIDGTKVIVEPKDYLSLGTDYVIDFPALYCDDVEFATPSSGFNAGYPIISGDQIRFTFTGNGEEKSLTVIAVGFDAEGKLCGAVSKDVTITGELSDYLEKEGLEEWDSIKFMVWENYDGYKMPLIETMEF